MSSNRLNVFLAITILAGCYPADGPTKVEQGLLEGAVSSDGTVSIYKGIPFAAPPVGDLRWRAPQPGASWEGVRQAAAFGASCMQKLSRSKLPWTEEFMVQNEASEDCLYLNIWAPVAQSSAPVLVYIHGGGFLEGSGEVKMYDGTNLAKKGIVVVTINYRLGVFGYLAHPELAAESEYNASGNYGTLDQRAALLWVQKNIAAFGGDPDRVTIAGQSAGAASVYYLVASPQTSGLFHRAIMQSGPGALASLTRLGSLISTRATAEETGIALLQRHGVPDISALRAVSAEDLMTVPGEGPWLRFSPSVDGWLLPEDPMILFASGKPQDVPMLTGMNADEKSASSRLPAVDYTALMKTQLGVAADTFLELYPFNSDEEAWRAREKSAQDLGLVALERVMANRAKTSVTEGYIYLFERGIPWPEHPAFRAFHTGEVPYVFNNLNLMDRPWETVDWEVADRVSSYWVNFVKTGSPNAGNLPQWPAFDPGNVQMMRLGETTAPRGLPHAGVVQFYHKLLAGD